VTFNEEFIFYVLVMETGDGYGNSDG